MAGKSSALSTLEWLLSRLPLERLSRRRSTRSPFKMSETIEDFSVPRSPPPPPPPLAQLLPGCEQLLTLYVDCLRVTDSRVDFVSTPALHYCAPSFSTFLASLQYSRSEMGESERERGGVWSNPLWSGNPWNNFYFSGKQEGDKVELIGCDFIFE